MTSSAGSKPGSRTHSLSPEHLGDVWAGAALAIVVLGVAMFIAAVGDRGLGAHRIGRI